jgi:hypothetical protein
VTESEHREGILHRIEEKLNHLLGRRDDDWHDRSWAPLDSPFASYSPGDPSPRLFGGPRVDAPGWDPSLAGPRFDRIDVGSVGTHAAHPVSSFAGAQTPLLGSHSSAREYYLLMQERAEQEDHEARSYAEYRGRRMREFDREYADYRRDRQDCFDRDFDAWRQNRKGPPKAVEEPGRSEAKNDAGEAEPVTAARQPGDR